MRSFCSSGIGAPLLLVITVFSMITNKLSIGIFYFQILLFVFILVAIFITFTLKVDKGSMTYQILLFTMPIYKKIVYPDQIIQVRFKRFGWGTKGAIIQVEKGLNIRIIRFAPEIVLEELESFAVENGIAISGTNRWRE
jgi:hypothetical protein